MNLFSPITEFSRGLRAYGRGVSWLLKHPRYFVILFLPMVISLVLVGLGWTFFINYDEVVFGFIQLDEPDGFWRLLWYYLCRVLVYVAFFVFSTVTGVLIANVLASPFYELVSVAVEKDLRGGQAAELSFWQSLRIVPEELKKILFILAISILVLFIPVINVISIFVTAFLVGWDFYDYALARRGWSFRKRLKFVMSDFWAVTGFGLWLAIPFVQFILMPMAITCGTLLSLDSLKKPHVK